MRTTHNMVSLRDWKPCTAHVQPRAPTFSARDQAPSLRLRPRRQACQATSMQEDAFYDAPRSTSKRAKQLRKKIDKSVAALRAASATLDAPPEVLHELTRMQVSLLAILEEKGASLPLEDDSSSSEDDEPRPNSTLEQVMQPVTTGSAGRVLVCTGKDCTKHGADHVLAAFEQAATSPNVQVIACKCLGKCKQAPAARIKVQGAPGSALHTCIRAHEASVLVGTYFVPVPAVEGDEASDEANQLIAC